jgi:hypothetical protein
LACAAGAPDLPSRLAGIEFGVPLFALWFFSSGIVSPRFRRPLELPTLQGNARDCKQNPPSEVLGNSTLVEGNVTLIINQEQEITKM